MAKNDGIKTGIACYQGARGFSKKIYSAYGRELNGSHPYCEINFVGWRYINQRFYYLPDLEVIVLEDLAYNQDFEENRYIIDLEPVLNLYRISGYENFVDENIINFTTRNNVQVIFKPGTLNKNQDYLDKLKAKYPNYYLNGNYLRLISGYVVINKGGETQVIGN